MASQSLSTMENKFVRASLRPTGLYLTVWRWLPRACPPWKTSLSEPLCAPPDCTSQSGDRFPQTEDAKKNSLKTQTVRRACFHLPSCASLIGLLILSALLVSIFLFLLRLRVLLHVARLRVVGLCVVGFRALLRVARLQIVGLFVVLLVVLGNFLLRVALDGVLLLFLLILLVLLEGHDLGRRRRHRREGGRCRGKHGRDLRHGSGRVRDRGRGRHGRHLLRRSGVGHSRGRRSRGRSRVARSRVGRGRRHGRRLAYE